MPNRGEKDEAPTLGRIAQGEGRDPSQPRLNDTALPGTYGPSADDTMGF